MSPKTIIAAVDLQHKDSDGHVVNEAILLAQTHGAEIELIFVIPDQQNSFAQHYIPEEMRQQVETAAERELAEFSAGFDWAGIAHRQKVLRGVVYETLIERAQEVSARFIVIGSSKPGLKDLFMGPNAARVARHAPCSVLVVRP